RRPGTEHQREATGNEGRLKTDRQARQVLTRERVVEVTQPKVRRQRLGPRSGKARDHYRGKRRHEHDEHDNGKSDEDGGPTSPAPQQHRCPPSRERSSTVRTPCGTARRARATTRSAPWRSPPPLADRT